MAESTRENYELGLDAYLRRSGALRLLLPQPGQGRELLGCGATSAAAAVETRSCAVDPSDQYALNTEKDSAQESFRIVRECRVNHSRFGIVTSHNSETPKHRWGFVRSNYPVSPRDGVHRPRHSRLTVRKPEAVVRCSDSAPHATRMRMPGRSAGRSDRDTCNRTAIESHDRARSEINSSI